MIENHRSLDRQPYSEKLARIEARLTELNGRLSEVDNNVVHGFAAIEDRLEPSYQRAASFLVPQRRTTDKTFLIALVLFVAAVGLTLLHADTVENFMTSQLRPGVLSSIDVLKRVF